MSDTSIELPRGWKRTTLGSIRQQRSATVTPGKAPEELFELYSVPAFPDKLPEIVSGKEVGSSKQLVTPRTVLLCKINPRINRVWVVGNYSQYIKIASTEWIPFATVEGVSPEYLCYYMQQNSLRDFLATNASGVGGSLMRVSPQKVDPFPFVLAPLAEQHRIVSKIEELFSDLDAGVAALERAKANLKRYRAAVLKEAVEGKLTEQWRAEHSDSEPASVLLARILEERRERWEADQLAAYAAKGKTPPKDWQEKYQEPAAPDVESLPELPEGWCWATTDMIGEIVGGITKGQKRKDSTVLREVPYLRVANVQRGYLDLSEIKTIPATVEEIEELCLRSGDILFNEGGDRDKLGRGWVWDGVIDDCIHQNHVFRLRLFSPDIQPKFVSHHGNTFGQWWFHQTGKQSVNLASINMTVLRRFPVPLPPAAEQVEIIQELEDRLSIIDRINEEITTGLSRASRLRQSILKRAFEGKLVPQDSNDEPASALLERIHVVRDQVNSDAVPQKKRNSKKRQTEIAFIDKE